MAGQEKAVPSSPEGVSEESEVVLGKRKTYPKKSLQQLGSPVELPQEVLVEFHLDTPPFDQQHANIPPNEGNVLPLPYAGAELADGPLHAKLRRAFGDAGF